MKSKKAITEGQIIAIIVITIASFMVIYYAIVEPTVRTTPSAFGDELCHMNAGIRDWMWVGERLLPLWLCSERKAVIEADDWGQCDPQYKEDFYAAEKARDTPKQKKALEKCASQQIAQLAMRCWYMYGKDGWDLGILGGNYDCFRVKVRNLGDVKISEKDMTDVMIEQDYCDYLANNKCAFWGPGGCAGCGSEDYIKWAWWPYDADPEIEKGAEWKIYHYNHAHLKDKVKIRKY